MYVRVDSWKVLEFDAPRPEIVNGWGAGGGTYDDVGRGVSVGVCVGVAVGDPLGRSPLAVGLAFGVGVEGAFPGRRASVMPTMISSNTPPAMSSLRTLIAEPAELANLATGLTVRGNGGRAGVTG